MRQLDARGLACPEPLLMFSNAYKSGGGFELVVDTEVVKENIVRLCSTKGITYSITDVDNGFTFKVEEK